MVSDSCDDCARRLPETREMQTKRAIIKLNLRGTANLLLWKPRARLWLAGIRNRAPAVERCGKSFLRSGRPYRAAVLLQPLQLFADHDFSVPGILVQRVPLAGKNQQLTRHIQRMQSA